MKQFKEFRMPPMTMARDNAIVGAELEESPLVMDDMSVVKTILNKIEKDVGKAFLKKKQEQVWPMLQTLAKFAGYGISKKAQNKGRTYRYDLKK